jgi:hypothetical protein
MKGPVFAVVLASGTAAMADAFGTDANQFTIDFAPISGGEAGNPHTVTCVKTSP